MGPLFWVVVAIWYVGIILLGVVNVGVFLLRYRAGLNPPRTQLVRGVMILAVLFVFPRLLPAPGLRGLWFGLLVALLLWEVGVWVRRGILRINRIRFVPLTTINHPQTNGPA
jgi:hypothetical protein